MTDICFDCGSEELSAAHDQRSCAPGEVFPRGRRSDDGWTCGNCGEHVATHCDNCGACPDQNCCLDGEY